MPVSEKSLANLRPVEPYPIGAKRQVGDYWMVKQEDKSWRYLHHIVAEHFLGRPLNPNERVYFLNNSPQAKENPQRDDIEVRIVPPKDNVTPGQRRRIIKRLVQAEEDTKRLSETLARINAFYGLEPGDRSKAGLPRNLSELT